MTCDWCSSNDADECEDPYLCEIYDEVWLVTICDNCYSGRADEI